MGIEIVEPHDLYVSSSKNVLMRTINGPKKVDVIYRRVDDIYIDPIAWRSDSAIGIPGIYEAWKKKKVSIVNAPGSGVADDKAVYAFVPKMIEFFLMRSLLSPKSKHMFAHLKKIVSLS